ncbi:cyclic lactone autoinducer peptide AgrD [Staphylococcus agnetis]|nr:cyclic lactone autoinducer peptide [Staphylococcus agnetis]PTH59016.1 cyclic lactone autoinducer peptide [Staphylococcus agnetis]
MALFESLFKVFTIFFKTLGNFAAMDPCTAYFDEPEVPQELREAE